MSQSAELRTLPIKDIHVVQGRNPRRRFDPIRLTELEASVKQDGVLAPVLVRHTKEGYELIAGERRFRAAKGAGLTDVPVRIVTVNDAKAQELALVENLQRVDLLPLDESDALLELSKTRSLDELEAITGRSRKYLYGMLALGNLIPPIRALLQNDILPLHYAIQLARGARDQQPAALDCCFFPLHDGDPYQRHNLRPLKELKRWLEAHVRLNPTSEDAAVMFPELVKQVDDTEKSKKIRILHLSTLHYHTDRREPKPILAQSWKLVDPEKRCDYAKEGIIVLGDGQRQIVLACIAKKECRTHWSQPKPEPEDVDKRLADERRRLEAEEQRRLQELWTTEGKPKALEQIARAAKRLPLTRDVAQWLLREVTSNAEDVSKLLGVPLAKLPKDRFVQALVLAVALSRSWSFAGLAPIAKRLVITITAPTLKGRQAA